MGKVEPSETFAILRSSEPFLFACAQAIISLGHNRPTSFIKGAILRPGSSIFSTARTEAARGLLSCTRGYLYTVHPSHQPFPRSSSKSPIQISHSLIRKQLQSCEAPPSSTSPSSLCHCVAAQYAMGSTPVDGPCTVVAINLIFQWDRTMPACNPSMVRSRKDLRRMLLSTTTKTTTSVSFLVSHR